MTNNTVLIEITSLYLEISEEVKGLIDFYIT